MFVDISTPNINQIACQTTIHHKKSHKSHKSTQIIKFVKICAICGTNSCIKTRGEYVRPQNFYAQQNYSNPQYCPPCLRGTKIANMQEQSQTCLNYAEQKQFGRSQPKAKGVSPYSLLLVPRSLLPIQRTDNSQV